MTDAERMKEMEELLREARAKICGGFSAMNKQNFHERLNTILDPPPDLDALASDLAWIAELSRPNRDGSIGSREYLWRRTHESTKTEWRAIAAWIERDRVSVAVKARYNAFTETCDAVETERGKRTVLNRRDGEGVY